MLEQRELAPRLTRRAFLFGIINAALAGCSLGSENLDSFSKTLPRQMGGTTWTGEWVLVNSPKGEAIVEGYFDQSGLFRHKILLVKIPTVTISSKPLTTEQMRAVFRKEVNHLYSLEFVDTVLMRKMNLASYPAEEVRVLQDGLAALSLSETEQRLLHLNYSDRQYNYDAHTNRPYYPDPESLTQSVLKEG